MDSTLAAETQNFLVPNATIFVVSLIFLVILWFFYRFVVPPLTKAMAERDEMNRRQAEERDAAVRRLAEAQERYDAALADARAQATAVKDEARADAQRIRDEMRAETDRKVAAIRERGEAELAQQRAEAVQELRGQIGGLSTDLAGRILGRPVALRRPERGQLPGRVGRAADGGRAALMESIAVWVAELVGFALMLFVLWRYVLPLVTRMVNKRQDEIQRQVDEANEASRKLEEAHGRFDNAVQQAEAEAARIRDDARADATRIREELTAQAEADVERMLQRGQDQLAAQRDQVVRGLRSELGGASLELAERTVHKELADDSARSATVDSFLSEIENLPSPRGRQVAAGGGA